MQQQMRFHRISHPLDLHNDEVRMLRNATVSLPWSPRDTDRAVGCAQDLLQCGLGSIPREERREILHVITAHNESRRAQPVHAFCPNIVSRSRQDCSDLVWRSTNQS